MIKPQVATHQAAAAFRLVSLTGVAGRGSLGPAMAPLLASVVGLVAAGSSR